jgi:hypothetical protein
MNKQLLLNGAVLMSMVGALLQAGEEHPVIAAASRLRATTHALKQAQSSEERERLKADLARAQLDLSQYDIGDSDDSLSGSESDSSSDDSDGITTDDNNNHEVGDATDDDGSHGDDDRDTGSASGIINADDASHVPHATSWNPRRIGGIALSAIVYRYVIAPRLAKQVRKMPKGRMRKILRVLTFAKRSA